MTGPAQSEMVLLWEEWHTKTKPRKYHCGSWHRPFPNSKNSPFQNKATWENEFYLPRNNGFALSLALKQRLGATRPRPVRKWDYDIFRALPSNLKGFFPQNVLITTSENCLITRVFFWIPLFLADVFFLHTVLTIHKINPPPPPHPPLPKKKSRSFLWCNVCAPWKGDTVPGNQRKKK